MEWIENGLIALMISLPALAGLMLVMAAASLTRLRLRRSAVSTVNRDAMPEQVSLTLDQAQPLLSELGFHYRYSIATEASLVTDSHTHIFTDVYQHVEGHTHALVTPSMTPEQNEPCTVSWVTLLHSGKALATVNCYLHNLISAPAGWVMHDDYLPELREAWGCHRRRLLSVNEAITPEGIDFFRANIHATEQFMPYCEKQGLLVRQGDHWQITWRTALRLAWQLFLGRRKVAKARALAGKSPAPTTSRATASLVPENTVEADVEAFERQLAVQRATRSSGYNKVKVFLLTAALFLGVGSLWISWTFLPILLVVIGLHEGGHYLAMKISGYRNLSIFFLPGLGGLATGEKASAGPWEKLLVYLAGPMPGIALAVGGLIGQLSGAFQLPGWFLEFLFACLVINYLNLLPFTPLDGGRVVETFLFARFPVARFVFAVLGLAAFLAFGFSTGDKVILVIAVFIGLSLPHQWRIMRVDRAIVRHGAQTLDEHGAIERIFTALQHPRFAGWPFAVRAAAVKALLPELQGRRANAIEAAAGITIYLACLCAPPVLAFVALPQLGGVVAGLLAMAGHNMTADDVDPEPTPAQASAAPRDWYAEAARLQSLAESQRLPVLLGAVEFAEDAEDDDKRDGFLKAAWDIAQKRPVQDYDRARTLMAMARASDQAQLRRQWLLQVISELEGLHDKPRLLLLAQAGQELAWEDGTTGSERVLLMRQAVAHREEAMAEGEHELVMTRLLLAEALDTENLPEQAEALLQQNIQGISVPSPTDRSRDALDRRIRRIESQVELAWFLNAHGRPKEASAVLDAAITTVPAKITMSWEHPNRQVREAHLWALLQGADAQALKASWQAYEKSRDGIPRGKSPVLLHEVDRFIVARSIADESLKAQAQASMLEALKSDQSKYTQSRLCKEPDLSRRWRAKQAQARMEAARMAGICANNH